MQILSMFSIVFDGSFLYNIYFRFSWITLYTYFICAPFVMLILCNVKYDSSNDFKFNLHSYQKATLIFIFPTTNYSNNSLSFFISNNKFLYEDIFSYSKV